MNPAAAWIQASQDKRIIDLSWMNPANAAVRPMFATPAAPEPPKAPPPPPPQAPPPPPGPSPAQLKQIAEADELLRALSGSLEALSEATHKEVGRIAEEILEISLAVAEELAAGAIEADPNRILALIIASLEMVGADQNVKVFLHPTAHEGLRSRGLLDNLTARGGITLIPDPKISDAGCIVESPLGRVDARVRARLNQLRHLFQQKMGAQQ